MADLVEVRQSIEATRARLREQEAELRAAEDEQKQAERHKEADRLEHEITDLETKRKALITRCRTSKDGFDRSVDEMNQCAIDVQQAEHRVRESAFVVNELLATRLPDYPNEQEIADRDAKIRAARAAHDQTCEASKQTWARYEHLREGRRRADDELARARNEAEMCASLLTGHRDRLRQLRPAPIPTSGPPKELAWALNPTREQAQIA